MAPSIHSQSFQIVVLDISNQVASCEWARFNLFEKHAIGNRVARRTVNARHIDALQTASWESVPSTFRTPSST